MANDFNRTNKHRRERNKKRIRRYARGGSVNMTMRRTPSSIRPNKMKPSTMNCFDNAGYQECYSNIDCTTQCNHYCSDNGMGASTSSTCNGNSCTCCCAGSSVGSAGCGAGMMLNQYGECVRQEYVAGHYNRGGRIRRR